MRTTSKSILACAAVCVGVAGCGSSGPSTTSSGNASGSSPKQGATAAYDYARCMRTHGVSNFPDPQVSTSPGQQSIKIAIPASVGQSPQFKTAQQACQHILPGPQDETAGQRHARAETLFAFARCLRSHGITKFPDPNSQGQLTLNMINAAGVDLHAPGVLTAGKACVGVTHGQITVADLEQAINHGTSPNSTTGSATPAP